MTLLDARRVVYIFVVWAWADRCRIDGFHHQGGTCDRLTS